MDEDLFKELGDLRKKHQELRESCESLKKEIDESVNRRDENNKLFKEMLDELKKAKTERDQANDEVSAYKKLRDEKR